MILGFDPGRDKCGIAVMKHASDSTSQQHIAYAEVVRASKAIATVLSLIQRYPISTIVMGDQTMAKDWKNRIETHLADQHWNNTLAKHNPEQPVKIPLVMIDERYSSLEARDRYWTLHPPQGLNQFLPKSLRSIPRPIDDVVAIILIERYWQTLEPHPMSCQYSPYHSGP